MPRQIVPDLPLSQIEDEIAYTRAALAADPDAEDQLPVTDDWLPGIDALRASMREARFRRVAVTARRVVANGRLDTVSVAFGDHLLVAVKKNRQDLRWRRYFGEAPNRFVRRPLGDQVTSTRGWLATQDPALEPFRAELTRWVEAAEAALREDAIGTQLTADLNAARAAHAAELTRKRDGLHRTLAQRAEERDLGRYWADEFFLKG